MDCDRDLGSHKPKTMMPIVMTKKRMRLIIVSSSPSSSFRGIYFGEIRDLLEKP